MSALESVAGGVPFDGTLSRPELDPRGFVTADELRQLSTIAPWSIVTKTVTTWALVASALWAWAATRNVLVFAAAFVVISACQHAFFLLAHEGAHYSVARRRSLNDLISDVFFAGPIFYTTARYREGHLPHHTHLGDHALDLERRTWVLIRGKHFLRLLVVAFSGWGALRAIIGLTPEKVGARESPVRYVVAVGGVNGAMLAYCWLLGAPLAYFALWLLPLFTLTYLLLIVRTVAEHQPLSYARRDTGDDGLDLVPVLTRTFATSWIERFVFAPVGAHHHEHHLLPGVPFAQLPRLHALLAARGYYAAQPECVETSYWSLLKRLILLPGDAEPRTSGSSI